jgi:pyridoxine kinase
MILILSSFVASSPVGGGAQLATLARLGIEAVLAPTVLFGRHPGLGPPGGGAVDAATFEGMLAGIEADGAFARADAVIAGYFARPDQAAAAARAIDAVRAARPEALIVVDPIMGDKGKGLYIRVETARAIADTLIPRADIVTPNTWELAYLSGQTANDAAGALRAARALGRAALVSSVAAGPDLGVLWAGEREAWLASHPRAPTAPNGVGDRLACLFTAARLGGAGPREALEIATGETAAWALGRPVEIRLEAIG